MRGLRLRWTRDGLLLLTGIAGIFHETVLWKGPERPSLLVLFAAMIGLPAFLKKDEKDGDK